MKHSFRTLALPTLISATLLLTSCSGTQAAPTEPETPQVSSLLDTATLFSDRDLDPSYDAASAVSIKLNGSSASCDSTAVSIKGSTVTIQQEGVYLVTGSLTDGQIVVNAPDTDKVQLVLSGTDITSKASAALYASSADKVFVTLADGTENTLTNGGTYTATDKNNVDAVIFSKSDLTLNGTGSLTINATAGHGVVSKDELVVAGGSYTITAADHGFDANDSLAIADGTFQVTSGKDAFHAEQVEDATLGFLYVADGSFTANAAGDAFSASGVLQLEDGDFNLTTGGGSVNGAVHTEDKGGGHMRPNDNGTALPPKQQEEPPANLPADGSAPTPPTDDAITGSTTDEAKVSAAPTDQTKPVAAEETTTEDTVSTKGLKASGDLTINGGTFTIDSADDAIHTNGTMCITDGTFTIKSGDDGLHADAALTVSGGSLTISKSYEGIEGLSVTLSGGDLLVSASDDGINAGGGSDQSGTNGGDAFAVNTEASILISGGTLTVNAEGDGIDSNGSLTVSGGTTYVYGPTNGGNGALDYNGEATIIGGTVIAFGAARMEQNFGSASTQGSILVSFDTQAAGSTLLLTDSKGNTLLSQASEKSYSSVVVSCPALLQGEGYTVTAGTSVTELTLDSLIYGSGNAMGGQRPEGAMGGKRSS